MQKATQPVIHFGPEDYFILIPGNASDYLDSQIHAALYSIEALTGIDDFLLHHYLTHYDQFRATYAQGIDPAHHPELLTALGEQVAECFTAMEHDATVEQAALISDLVWESTQLFMVAIRSYHENLREFLKPLDNLSNTHYVEYMTHDPMGQKSLMIHAVVGDRADAADHTV